jgi:hypothetical protein
MISFMIQALCPEESPWYQTEQAAVLFQQSVMDVLKLKLPTLVEN